MTLDRIAFLGGYPPRQCGIATFTQDLCEAVAGAAPGSDCFVGAVNDRIEGYSYGPRVRFELFQNDLDSYRRAADFLNFSNAEVLSIQHEFGIHGGPTGSHLLTLLREVRMPIVTTLHTVLQAPSPAQRAVMEEVVRRSSLLVIMARKGKEILQETYGIPAERIEVIPHGIPDVPFMDSWFYKAQFGVEGRTVLFTFGLLGPGKGIEYAIEALPAIVARHPHVVYLVLGATHPHLVARDGENYRLSLERLAEERGVKDHVIFYNRFVSLEDLKEFIGATDIYLTPYLSEAQITSGTLAYAFGAGKAVVSTPYWHAQELLADGRGTLVPFRDAAAITEGVCTYLDNPRLLESTRRMAYGLGRDMLWSSVGQRYLEAFARVRTERRASPRAAFAQWTLASRPYELPPLRLDHLVRMTDGLGLLHHATFNVPNIQDGYCTDDNARAYILCLLLEEQGGESLDRLSTSYLAFMAAALNRTTGRFRNVLSPGRDWMEESGSEDSHGRALWAAGTGAARARNGGHRKLCIQLFEAAAPAVETMDSPRAWAFALMGIREYLRPFPDREEILRLRTRLTSKLIRLWHQCSTDHWPWFEPRATYDNARLCQALIISGMAMPEGEALAIGLKSLEWLVSVQKAPGGHYRPIGSHGFYDRDGAHADFDQQPVEAQAMVAACQEAFLATRDPAWIREAKRAFEWFLGRNDLGIALYDSGSGGCADGLYADRVNENQGAESTLAFHLSLAEMNAAAHRMASPPEHPDEAAPAVLTLPLEARTFPGAR